MLTQTTTGPAADPTTPSRIVIGVDGSESSKTAVRWAHSLARMTGGTLQAVAAWQPYAPAYGYNSGITVPDWNPAVEANKIVEETLDEVFGTERPADLDIVVREGSAARVLLDISRDARMLVVGSRGHGGFAGLLLGSVSSACAEHAACPVLVVHGSTAPAVAA